MDGLKLKVCGMKFRDNLKDLVAIGPDYIGFILYPKSPRYMVGSLSADDFTIIPKEIKKVGVFVNENPELVLKYADLYRLDIAQLHGNESPEYCRELGKKLKIIKAFAMDEGFDFSQLKFYEDAVDYFMFDTKTPKYGGSGQQFNWGILLSYHSPVPYFLSGGIGLKDIPKILEQKLKGCFAIDINSKVEIDPGLKDLEQVRSIKEILNQKESIKTSYK